MVRCTSGRAVIDNKTVSAKTYDEAITKACIELQTTSRHLHVDIIEKGSNGLFGVLGGKPCVIRARVMSEDEEAAAEKAAEDTAKEAARREEEARAKEEEARKAAEKKAAPAETEKKPDEKEPAENPKAEKTVRETGRKKTEEKPKKEVSEEEAEVLKKKAQDFLEAVFKTMNEEISIETSFDHEENELAVLLNGADMGILIGKRGQTLDSLQYLVSLVINKHHDGYIRVKLDTENYRERREEKLKILAKNIASKVKRTRKPVSLEPMNPYERRIIHSALQDDPICTTYSEGEDPYRHIVVVLKKDMKKINREA